MPSIPSAGNVSRKLLTCAPMSSRKCVFSWRERAAEGIRLLERSRQWLDRRTVIISNQSIPDPTVPISPYSTEKPYHITVLSHCTHLKSLVNVDWRYTTLMSSNKYKERRILLLDDTRLRRIDGPPPVQLHISHVPRYI
jgi:hypothetical protein